MKIYTCCILFICLASTLRAQTPTSPVLHTPETIHADGARYNLAHLDRFEPKFVCVVHQFGRAVVRWDSLDPSIQQEYAAEHCAAVLAAVPVAPVAKATPHPPQPTHEPSSANPDIKLSDGRVFHDAVVIASDPASITIRYCGGIARVDLATLPEDDRAKLAPQYDPQKAAAYKAAEARALDEAAQVQETQAVMDRFDANALNFSGKVVQVSESGAIMEGGGHTDDQTKEVMINGTSTKVATLPGKSTDYDRVFVAGAGDGMVDGDHWSGKVWMAGRYQYTTVMGAIRTIPRLAADRDLALRLLGSGK